MKSGIPIALIIIVVLVPACHDNKETEALQEEASSRMMMIHEGFYRLNLMQPGMLDSRENFTSTLDSLLRIHRVIHRVEQNDTLLNYLGRPASKNSHQVNDRAEELMIRHWKNLLDTHSDTGRNPGAYTSLLSCWFILGRTAQVMPFPWHPGMKFSAATQNNMLLVTGECNTTHSFTLVFHTLRNKRLPEGPAWQLPGSFPIDPGHSYTVKRTGLKSVRLPGKELLEGLPLTWEAGVKQQLIIHPHQR